MALRTLRFGMAGTQKKRIDKVLRAAGWQVTPNGEKPLGKFGRWRWRVPPRNGPAD